MRSTGFTRMRRPALLCLLMAVTLFLALPEPLQSMPAGPDHHSAAPHHGEAAHTDHAAVSDPGAGEHCHPGIDCFYLTILASPVRLTDPPGHVAVAFRAPASQAKSLRLGFDPPPPRV